MHTGSHTLDVTPYLLQPASLDGYLASLGTSRGSEGRALLVALLRRLGEVAKQRAAAPAAKQVVFCGLRFAGSGIRVMWGLVSWIPTKGTPECMRPRAECTYFKGPIIACALTLSDMEEVWGVRATHGGRVGRSADQTLFCILPRNLLCRHDAQHPPGIMFSLLADWASPESDNSSTSMRGQGVGIDPLNASGHCCSTSAALLLPKDENTLHEWTYPKRHWTTFPLGRIHHRISCPNQSRRCHALTT